MMEARLPPGFRFHPRDDELVLDYLCHKLSGRGGGAYGGVAMVDVDLNKREPWDLPDEACVGGSEWYFFSLHDRKYATGHRTNRATQSGYWKATGKDRSIIGRHGGGAVVGMRKTLVFYQGRAPRGTKTEWIMHEFRVEGQAVAAADHPASSPPLKEDWVLCRVFYKSRTATPRAASDEAGSLNGDLSVAPALLPMAPVNAYHAAFGRAPTATIDGYYYEQQGSGLPAAHHRPAPLPSFRDLLRSMVEEGGSGPKPEFPQGWSEGYVEQNGTQPQTWNPLSFG